MSGVLELLARSGVPAAAVLMSAGFFASSAGRDVTQPNRLIWVLYAGVAVLTVAVLTVGVVSVGVGLLIA